ncbi:aldehyde dehydrogenase family protein [Actinomadura sp. NPDC023710]|uniref:aldehyde dehydrogenase family protein n=1 Tax=Actinomadura sp. NPDC023710 TaxID=3158219 RepID=UPI0033D19EA7
MLRARTRTSGRPTRAWPVLRVADDAEATLPAANRAPYGLTSAVFGRDLDRTLAVAGRLRAGQVTVDHR